jgi:hypothetical protein
LAPGWGNQPTGGPPSIPVAANPVAALQPPAESSALSDDSDGDKIRKIEMPPLNAPRAAHQDDFLLRNMRRKSLDFGGIIPNMGEAKFLKAQYRAMIQHQPPCPIAEDRTFPKNDADRIECVRQLYEAALNFDHVDKMPTKGKRAVEPVDPNHDSYDVRSKLLLFGIELSGIELEIQC